MRIVGLVALLVLATGAVISAILIESSRSVLRDEILAKALTTTDVAAELVDRTIRSAQHGVRAFAARPGVVRAILADHPEAMTEDLIEFQRGNPIFDSLGFVDARGIQRASSAMNRPAGTAVDREWFQVAMASGQPYLGLPVVSRPTGRPVVPYAVPIVDAHGQVRAVLTAGISLAELADAITGIRIGPQARAALIDRRDGGRMLAHIDPARVMGPIDQNEMARRVLAGERGAMESIDTRDAGTLAAFAQVSSAPWAVEVQQPISPAFASIDDLTWRAVALTGIVLTVAVGLAALLALAITRPLRRLHRAADAVAAGDLTQRVGIQRHDEIGALGRAFDDMAVALAHRTGQLEASVKELEAFSYTVSHDLRAPLRAIDGFSRILLEEHAPSLAPEVRRQLAVVRSNAQQMGQLIDDLLKFARLSRQPLTTELVRPGTLARQVMDELRLAEEGRRVDVSVEDLPACRADPSLLKQVYGNLLANALKFTRHREVAKIEVGWRTEGAERIYYVRDNGAGFDMRYVDKLFGVFQRLHKASEYEGTGVGLAIVQRIVHRHGGRIWAEGEIDQGATFNFTLGEEGSS